MDDDEAEAEPGGEPDKFGMGVDGRHAVDALWSHTEWDIGETELGKRQSSVFWRHGVRQAFDRRFVQMYAGLPAADAGAFSIGTSKVRPGDDLSGAAHQGSAMVGRSGRMKHRPFRAGPAPVPWLLLHAMPVDEACQPTVSGGPRDQP